MKKGFLAVLLVMIAALSVTACSQSFKKIDVNNPQTDFEYAVLSNGGSAVQYGKYIYFINGTRGFDDENGTANKWGNVYKGGLYRAELLGKEATREYSSYFGTTNIKVWDTEYSAETGLPFVSRFINDEEIIDYEIDAEGEFLLDDDGNKIPIYKEEERVTVELIAPKTIGTSGYSQGGIFIYDEWVFYASPNNLKDRDGKVQSAKTDFYRTKLDGSRTDLIYTTKNDSADAAYAFYKQNDKYYLVSKDGSEIVSVTMTAKKVNDPVVIAEDVTSVCFPTRDVYYKGITTNGAEDFIYYNRSIRDDDSVRTGEILEVMRPDGSERFTLYAGGTVPVMHGVNNGLFFYQVTGIGGDKIFYTNLHNELLTAAERNNGDEVVSPSYKENPAHKAAVVGEVPADNIKSYTSFVCFAPDYNEIGDVYLIGVSSSGIYRSDSRNRNGVQISGTADAVIVKVADGMLYYTAGGKLYSLDIMGGEAKELVTDAADHTYDYDFVDDQIVYFGRVDDFADGYALFKDTNNGESKFVGFIIDDDKAAAVEDEEEEEVPAE